MDQAENSRDDPHGLTDLDLGGQPRPAQENDFNPGAHVGAWGGEGVPTASLADVVPPLPDDSFVAEDEPETEGERPVRCGEISIESEDVGPEQDSVEAESRPPSNFRERSPRAPPVLHEQLLQRIKDLTQRKLGDLQAPLDRVTWPLEELEEQHDALTRRGHE